MQRPGLTHVPTPRLEALLKALVSGRLGAPLTPPSLMLAGFSDLFDQLAVLHGLDAAGVRAVLVVAIAERREAARRSRSGQ
jgi:hypothetical protein